MTLPVDFADSAAYHLYRLDLPGDSAQILHFRPEDYGRATFLDERALGHRRIGAWSVAIAEVEQRVAAAAERALPVHWLFHIGHCGSTLVSRLLDALPGVLGLREPLPLLELTGLELETDHPWGRVGPERFAAGVRLATRLLARGFAGTHAVVVKPTSLVFALAARLLDASPRGHAALLWIDLESWLAAMLKDPQLPRDVRQQSAIRVAGWHRLTGESDLRTWTLDDAELLAMGWLVEQLRFAALSSDTACTARCIALDFDALLADPGPELGRLARHFALDATPAAIDAALGSGLLERNAKDTTRHYDAATRQAELETVRARRAPDIARGLAWAEAALARLGNPPIPGRLRAEG